jgi:hypothetical protein
MHPGPKMGEKRKWGGLCEVKSWKNKYWHAFLNP